MTDGPDRRAQADAERVGTASGASERPGPTPSSGLPGRGAKRGPGGDGASASPGADPDRPGWVPEPVAVDRRPTRVGAGLATTAAAAGVILAGSAAPAAAPAALGGLTLVGIGVTYGSTTAVVLGALGVFAGGLVAGLLDGGTVTVVGTTLLAALAWDLGSHAVDLGRRVGRSVPTARSEAAHAAASVAVGASAAGAALAVFVTGSGGLPSSVLLLLVVGAVALMAAVRH